MWRSQKAIRQFIYIFLMKITLRVRFVCYLRQNFLNFAPPDLYIHKFINQVGIGRQIVGSN